MKDMLILILYLLLIISTLLAGETIRQIKKSSASHLPAKVAQKSEAELPSVSVCIPARNEMHAMTACLESVVASTYPKMEVLVLDDQSRDTTSIVIKSFAHAGVRFIEGAPLEKDWLGKNFALNELLSRAVGTYVIFMDVDTRITRETITQVVQYAEDNNLTMVSVIPRRHDVWRASAVFSSLRWFWQLVGSQAAEPAASSTFWLIKREYLLERNGFSEASQSIQPESFFAQTLAKDGQYECITQVHGNSVTYEKKWLSQMETSTRLLFPHFNHSFITILGVIAGLLLTLLPLGTIWLIGNHWIVGIVSLVALCAWVFAFTLYARVTYTKARFIRAVLYPYLVVQEIALIIRSLIGYTRGTITWKGRPIRSTRN